MLRGGGNLWCGCVSTSVTDTVVNLSAEHAIRSAFLYLVLRFVALLLITLLCSNRRVR